MTTMPITMPITACRAALESLAEKNFWYIPLSPIRSKKVGMATPTTHRKLCPPNGGQRREHRHDQQTHAPRCLPQRKEEYRAHLTIHQVAEHALERVVQGFDSLQSDRRRLCEPR